MNNASSGRRYVDGKLVEGELPAPFVPLRACEVEPEPISQTERVSAAVEPRAEGEITDTAQMRAFLLKQMVFAANGEINTEKVKNVCALAQQIYNATKLELQAAQILRKTEATLRTLELTGPHDE